MALISTDGHILSGRAGVQARIAGIGLIPDAYGDWDWLEPDLAFGQLRAPDRMGTYRLTDGQITTLHASGTNFHRAGGGRWCVFGWDSVLGALPGMIPLAMSDDGVLAATTYDATLADIVITDRGGRELDRVPDQTYSKGQDYRAFLRGGMLSYLSASGWRVRDYTQQRWIDYRAWRGTSWVVPVRLPDGDLAVLERLDDALVLRRVGADRAWVVSRLSPWFEPDVRVIGGLVHVAWSRDISGIDLVSRPLALDTLEEMREPTVSLPIPPTPRPEPTPVPQPITITLGPAPTGLSLWMACTTTGAPNPRDWPGNATWSGDDKKPNKTDDPRPLMDAAGDWPECWGDRDWFAALWTTDGAGGATNDPATVDREIANAKARGLHAVVIHCDHDAHRENAMTAAQRVADAGLTPLLLAHAYQYVEDFLRARDQFRDSGWPWGVTINARTETKDLDAFAETIRVAVSSLTLPGCQMLVVWGDFARFERTWPDAGRLLRELGAQLETPARYPGQPAPVTPKPQPTPAPVIPIDSAARLRKTLQEAIGKAKPRVPNAGANVPNAGTKKTPWWKKLAAIFGL